MNLNIPKKSICVLLGPNGSGKSTLLRNLAGLLHPQTGAVRIGGRDISQLKPLHRGRTISFLPQVHAVPEMVSVESLISRGRHPHQRWGWSQHPQDREKVRMAISTLGLEAFAHRIANQLSGGELQRVWIAMALAQDTPVILLDEPLTHLDLYHQWELLEILKSLRDEHGKTIVVVMHELGPAAALADQVILMKDGGIKAAGPANQVLAEESLYSVFNVKVDVRRCSGCERRPSLNVY